MLFCLKGNMEKYCAKCGEKITCKYGKYCEKCRKIISSETMIRTNKKYASERMIKNNPMKREEIRKKVSESLLKIGHKPKQRGGNGTQTPNPVKIIFIELSAFNPILEYVIPTKAKRVNEEHLPTNYKVDIALPCYKIAIEVDGASHHATGRKEQDEKKDALLKSLGWKVVRITNKEALLNAEIAVSKIKQLCN